MKTHLLRISVLAAAAATGIYAQNSNAVTANVPFDFMIGGRTVHAGQYVIDQGQGLVAVKSESGRVIAYAIGGALVSPLDVSQTKLVFHRYGDKYFLWQVWRDGAGREIPKTKRERELSASRHDPETIFLLASR